MSDVQTTVQNTLSQYEAGKFNKAGAAAKMAAGKSAEKASEDFEAVFISQMLTPMFEGIEPDGLFGGGSAENIYKSMMIEEYGKIIAANGGIGVADAVKAEIIEMQAKQQGKGQ